MKAFFLTLIQEGLFPHQLNPNDDSGPGMWLDVTSNAEQKSKA